MIMTTISVVGPPHEARKTSSIMLGGVGMRVDQDLVEEGTMKGSIDEKMMIVRRIEDPGEGVAMQRII